MMLKDKVVTQFPALVTAASPLTLVKNGLAYAFGFDINALRATLDAIYLNPSLTSIILSGSTSGTVTLKAPAVAGSSILTFPAATDTVVARATTDTLTNKTFDTAGAGNNLSINGVAVTANTGTGAVVRTAAPTISQPNIVGTTTNDSAAAGSVGEYVESVVAAGSAVSLANNTPKTITSISLTAGDWDIDSVISFFPANTTQFTQLAISISGTTNTLDVTPGKFFQVPQNSITSTGAQAYNAALPNYRLSLATTTTIYAVVQSAFTVSTMTGYGIIRARRIR